MEYLEYIIGISILLFGFIFGFIFEFWMVKRKGKIEVPEKTEEKSIVRPSEKVKKEELYDIVYILKNDMDDVEELRYSLRSLVNFKYKNVWFAGGKPKKISSDKYMPIQQKGKTRWERVSYTLKQVCQNEEISENFWLFNDDFFIMKPHKQVGAYFDGDLAYRILSLEDSRGRTSYSKNLRKCLSCLINNGLPTKNYALHVPMLINKEKALEVLEKYPDITNFRNIYGNYLGLEAEKMEDVKYSDNSKNIDTNSIFLSTLERSFASGKIGKYIRENFPEPSRYEK